MTTTTRRTRFAALGAALLLPLAATACSSEETGPATAPSTESSPSMGSTPSTEASPSMGSSPRTDAAMGGEPFGAACAEVPTDGEGSVEGMADDPVATAASNNPLLSTLVTAVGEAGLGDTLNSQQAITVFAPTNEAFGAVDPETMDAAMGDPTGLLTDVLTAHVVPERLSPEMLAGEHETLNGEQLVMVEGSGEEFTVNGEAMVVCGNVQTANATVYLIDQVLLPTS
ncbi:fasciclin domain-containing protein [Desertihabitans brevis]|uniref:Fasciclin domain-containing protein n=2 Tax=Desertihabitans brevis TaxID=2268447 RepID=A0A367YX65_9ACTN|nr:fasciclin domain-containing protein [Desertihabitans brevis]